MIFGDLKIKLHRFAEDVKNLRQNRRYNTFYLLNVIHLKYYFCKINLNGYKEFLEHVIFVGS